MKMLHDVHLHDYLSRCTNEWGATAMSMIREAERTGLRLIGFSNHTWDESVPLPAPKDFYKKQSLAYQAQIRDEVAEYKGALKILIGAETEYCGMYDVLGMGKEAALQFDYLLIPHSHVHMRDFVMPSTPDVVRAREALTQKLAGIEGITPERAVALAAKLPEKELEPYMGEKTVDYVQYVSDFMVKSFKGLMDNEVLKSYSDLMPVSVAHPFQPCGSMDMMDQMIALIPDHTFGDLFAETARRGIGLEINPWTNTPESYRMFAVAKACGCKFTLGSDAHGAGEMPQFARVADCIAHVGITEDDLMDFVRV
ncbi:MAG: hypothetical protein IJF31_02180 [Clostridia bacterium]|nr:hypothetical protein [Clostridia bacterium]